MNDNQEETTQPDTQKENKYKNIFKMGSFQIVNDFLPLFLKSLNLTIIK